MLVSCSSTESVCVTSKSACVYLEYVYLNRLFFWLLKDDKHINQGSLSFYINYIQTCLIADDSRVCQPRYILLFLGFNKWDKNTFWVARLGKIPLTGWTVTLCKTHEDLHLQTLCLKHIFNDLLTFTPAEVISIRNWENPWEFIAGFITIALLQNLKDEHQPKRCFL